MPDVSNPAGRGTERGPSGPVRLLMEPTSRLDQPYNEKL